ncbi:MAG TPA: hypothetical protein PKG54_09770 [Phycisphaerae bacterium]|jgi:hypothetical protein|nr:hypothetical protein [Phycisphaerae bacterium]HOB74803.1 hypothetical protein [Phycisphaerae bacterium]HPU32952.1 hypothetical protein [Phycisphaerae bacterium]HQA44422.1 hypothetical protein [Phycisphaerae bacterium]HQE44239.1 hypothetical protein [Phycisphaerae bacterium]
MPRSMTYLLTVVVGLAIGPAVAALLWMNPVAAVLALYGAGLALFLLGVDAVLSREGVRGFFREAEEAGRCLGALIISVMASTGIWIALHLLAFNWVRRVLGAILPFGPAEGYFPQTGGLLLLPLAVLGALFAVLTLLEFAAAGSRWWRRLRMLLMAGWRGRLGLMLLAALISAVIISIIRWEIQLLAMVLVGLGLFAAWLLVDLLFPRSRIWAVARQTVAEALHYKIVVAWVLVILLLIFALPPAITGDGLTLKSRVQSYLQVTLTIIGLGLGLLTVGLAAFTLPNEINKKLIFMTTSKPIPRWQIFVGKWVGIGVLNVGLLLFSGAAVWGFTWYLKSQPTTEEDRIAVEQEVIKVRHGIPLSEPPDLAAQADEIVRKERETGKLTADQVEERRRTKLEELQRTWRSLRPRGGHQTYVFRNLLVDREKQDWLHIRIKPNSPSGVDDIVWPVLWQAGDPNDVNTLTNVVRQEIPTERVTMLVVPVSAVNAEGTLYFRMQNLNERDTMIFEGNDSFELLYGLGTFHWNLVRALAIIWCRLAFVAAIGLFFSTFVSFPVAFVLTLFVFLVSLMSNFLAEALDAATMRPYGRDPVWGSLKLGYVLTPLGKAVVWLMPNFSKYDASGNIADGRLVPLMWVLISFASLAVFWCLILGVLGCVLLTQRELAREGA